MSVILEERVKDKVEVQKPKKYNLWALNNDNTAFNEVVAILTQALGMNRSVAEELTFKIDREGRAKLNPAPLSYNVAQAYLNRLNTVKRKLAEIYKFRRNEIMELKFITKED